MWLSKKAEHEYEIEYEYDDMARDHMNGVYIHTLRSERALAHMIELSLGSAQCSVLANERCLTFFFLSFSSCPLYVAWIINSTHWNNKKKIAPKPMKQQQRIR